MFPDKPTANPPAEAVFGYATDVTPGGRAVVTAHRVQLCAAAATRSEQIRGGIGMFSGRTPYVWLSNQFGNTGIEIHAHRRDERRRATAFPSWPTRRTSRRSSTGATGRRSTNEIDLIDPDYKYPTLMRGNLAYDRELPWGLVGSGEVLFTNDIQDIKYQNLNRVPCLQSQSGMPGGRSHDAEPGRPADSQPPEQQLLGRDLPDELG